MTLLAPYADRFPNERERLYCDWHACYTLDRFDLLDGIVGNALTGDVRADGPRISNSPRMPPSSHDGFSVSIRRPASPSSEIDSAALMELRRPMEPKTVLAADDLSRPLEKEVGA